MVVGGFVVFEVFLFIYLNYRCGGFYGFAMKFFWDSEFYGNGLWWLVLLAVGCAWWLRVVVLGLLLVVIASRRERKRHR